MNTIIVFGVLIKTTLALWSCTSNLDCAGQAGSVCVDGSCECPAGQQAVFGGTLCVGVAPYHSSPCYEDHQCSRLWANYECRRSQENPVGTCECQDGFHYFLGRCWRSRDFRETCGRDEECITVPRDPFALKCDGVCACADGYYERQRGECRKIGRVAGDDCVVDEDCQFPGGSCDINTLSCVDTSNLDPSTHLLSEPAHPYIALASREVDAIHNVSCSSNGDCVAPEECSFGACVCPMGFYRLNNKCYAELGTSSTPEQCDGLLAVVIDGICSCPANFFYDQNMRDCIRVTRRITDSCVSDENCHTFGAQSRCGEPQQPWGLRSCECITENAVWNANRNMCRLFAGVGERCDVDSDCLVEELDIRCVDDDQGEGYCRCPPHLTEVNGLCLNSGLVLNDRCQASQECNGTANAVCTNSTCSCAVGFQQEDNYCAPVIGGPCIQDSDCIVPDTVCRNGSDGNTCQCEEHLVTYDQSCYTVSSGENANCTVSAQCQASMGEDSSCVGGLCTCVDGSHYRDGRCWPITDLFQICSRTSECYLPGKSEVVLCRNGRCQCDFDHPYSEELRTCVSSAATGYASLLLTISALCVYLWN